MTKWHPPLWREVIVSDLFAYIWAYRVPTATSDLFRALYGPNGEWVGLFRQASGYIDTQLLQDRDDPERFVTIDRWETEESFNDFRADFSLEFERLDRKGDQFTVEEMSLGEFRSAE
jgi:heme-degrading monooxygenase HmoA